MQGVYKIINKLNGKYYVGESSDVESRWHAHKWSLKRGDHNNPYLQSAWNKYREEGFVFEFSEEVLGGEEARLAREQVYLDGGFEKGILYNIAKKADCPPSRKGEKLTKEHKAKIGRPGKDNAFYGKCHTEEAKRKNREAHLGKSSSRHGKVGYWRGKVGPFRGKNHTIETKAKLSKAQKGKKHSKEAKAKIGKAAARIHLAFYNVKTGVLIPAGYNLARLCRDQGLSYSSFSNLKLGVTVQSYDGWRLATKGEIGVVVSP